MNDDGWDFGADDEANPEEVERALRSVVKKGQRRRTARSTTGVVAAVAVVVAGLVYGAPKVQSPLMQLTGIDHETTTTTPPTTSMRPPLSAGRPKTLVVYGAARPAVDATVESSTTLAAPGPETDYALMVLDSQTGELVETLSTNPGITDVKLSPDRQNVYYEAFDTTLPNECHSIYETQQAAAKAN